MGLNLVINTSKKRKLAKVRVLLVDDHQMFREGIKSVINSREDLMVIGEASNGVEAIDKTLDLKPQVVVMDINMPVMNGIKASKKIKELNKEVKILMLTLIDSEKFIIDALSNGADSYLSKDVDISELLKVIRKLADGEEYINKEISKKIFNYISWKKLVLPSNIQSITASTHSVKN